MKTLNIILFYLKYFVYFLITVEERNNYLQSEIKGYKCTHSKDDSLFLYGSARIYYFDPSKPPERNYLTFKEYKESYYPKN